MAQKNKRDELGWFVAFVLRRPRDLWGSKKWTGWLLRKGGKDGRAQRNYNVLYPLFGCDYGCLSLYTQCDGSSPSEAQTRLINI